MPKKLDGTKLTDKEIEEIHKLATEGCPCCKQPIPGPILAAKYGGISSSTISRIRTGRYTTSTADAVQNGAGR